MNKTRIKYQEMDIKKAGIEQPTQKVNKRGNPVGPNKVIMWVNPFPSREERRFKIRKRAGYTRTSGYIKKVRAIAKNTKQKTGFFNKVRAYLNRVSL